MQISLKDLLAIVAVCAGVAWCALQVGFDNGRFWFAVCTSAIMSAAFVRAARKASRRPPLSPLFFALCAFLLMSITLFVNALLLLLAGALYSRRPMPSIRDLSAVAMVCMLVALVFGVIPGVREARKLQAIRQEFPIISLASRLQYEQRTRRSDADQAPITNVSITRRLDEIEERLENTSYHRYRFQRLHDHQYELFVRTVGFGVGRMMMPMQVESLRLPPLRNIRFDESAGLPGKGGRAWGDFWNSGNSNAIEHLHIVSRDDFLDSDSFGALIGSPLEVVGFVSHALHYSPTASLEDRESWTIERLELVSLLKFEEPRVYVLDHLPRMDQISGDTVPTRSLDAFEAGALEQLRTEEDLVVTHEGRAYRMLGSLRAAKQCLDCHTAQRGELLGAFSYALRQTLTSGVE